jgi:hypothetical protein
MNNNERVIARLMFQNKVLKAKGQQFEDLFVSVMEYARKDFRPIKPQGNIGDRKNDGCEPIAGRYYQVYAPEDASQKESTAITKIETDFAGLLAYWSTLHPSGIKEFFFVLNDRYHGPYPTTQAALFKIQTSNGLDKADVFICKDLEQVVLSELADDQIQVIAGFVPDTSAIVRIDYSILTEVIGHILRNDPDKAKPGKLISPEFEQKIKFNNLFIAAPYLRAGSYQSNAVDAFFEKNVDFARQAVREALNDMYVEATEKSFSDDSPGQLTKEDKMFFHILSSATPYVNGSEQPGQVQSAVLVVMAYFFETCDIFEEPT